MPETAILQLPDQSLELPLLTGTENEKAIDISKLRAQTGYITLDTGFMNTGSCTSAVTFLDGEKGILRYRGYPIEQLAEHSSFVEVSYLVIYGELPTQEQLASFSELLSQHSLIHEDLKQVFGGFSKSAHPMVILSAMVASLSAYYSEASGKASVENLDINAARLLAKIRTIAAFSFKKTIGPPFTYPTDSLAYVPNFLNMMFAVPAESYEIHPDVARALELLLILHADHEQNCSASTVRVVGSSMANVYASVASGILALWGPLHGGANQAVLEMLAQIQSDGGDVDKFIKLGKDPDSGFRLMGFGHRVYKNYDPRAKIIKVACDRVLRSLCVQDPLLDIARKLEEAALSDPYFVERKLYPNVDFYSGIIFKAIGIPESMFTVIFAVARTVGWVAQWNEMIEDPSQKIGRPRQLYTGPLQREFVALDRRA